MKIGMVQMRVIKDKEANLNSALKGIKEAAEKGAEIIVLPEMFLCPFVTEYFPDFAEPKGGRVYTALKEAAKETGVPLVAGSMPELDGDRMYNTCFVFDGEGNEIACHRKAHLYDVDIEGRLTFRESDSFGFGDKVTLFEVGGHKFGVVVCFDIRFPEMFRNICLKGAEAIFIPAAFNTITGPMHWELLLTMRAVDNQLFTIGVSPANYRDDDYVAYGHSIICDPWGNVIEDAGEESNVVVVEADLNEVNRVREELPLLKLRRTHVYELESQV